MRIRIRKPGPCAALCAAGLLAGGVGAGELRPHEASYAITWKGMTAGFTTMSLRQGEAGHWTYDSVTEPRGLFRMVTDGVRQHSEMELTASGIRPLRYTGDDGSAKAERDIALRFDWERGRVSGTAEGKPVDEEIAPGTQDDLSVQVALTHALDNGGMPTSFRTYGDRGAREYTYTREGTETLATPLGMIATIVFRSQRSGSPRNTRYWCAPSLGYLPLRAQQRRNDDIEWTMDIKTLQR